MPFLRDGALHHGPGLHLPGARLRGCRTISTALKRGRCRARERHRSHQRAREPDRRGGGRAAPRPPAHRAASWCEACLDAIEAREPRGQALGLPRPRPRPRAGAGAGRATAARPPARAAARRCRWASRTSSTPRTCRPRTARCCTPGGGRCATPRSSPCCARRARSSWARPSPPSLRSTRPARPRNPHDPEHTPGGSSRAPPRPSRRSMVPLAHRHPDQRLRDPAGGLLRRLRLQAEPRPDLPALGSCRSRGRWTRSASSPARCGRGAARGVR